MYSRIDVSILCYVCNKLCLLVLSLVSSSSSTCRDLQLFLWCVPERMSLCYIYGALCILWCLAWVLPRFLPGTTRNLGQNRHQISKINAQLSSRLNRSKPTTCTATILTAFPFTAMSYILTLLATLVVSSFDSGAAQRAQEPESSRYTYNQQYPQNFQYDFTLIAPHQLQYPTFAGENTRWVSFLTVARGSPLHLSVFKPDKRNARHFAVN